MKERLRRFMSAEAVNSTQLAKILEIQSSGISHILSGRNKPSYDFVTKLLSEFPNLNPDWLLLGKGPMHRDEIRSKNAALHSSTISPIVTPQTTTPTTATEQSSDLSNTLPFVSPQYETEKTEPENLVAVSSEIACTKRVERIMVLYSDGSFDTYTPKK